MKTVVLLESFSTYIKGLTNFKVLYTDERIDFISIDGKDFVLLE